jgi:hypothetical protein
MSRGRNSRAPKLLGIAVLLVISSLGAARFVQARAKPTAAAAPAADASTTDARADLTQPPALQPASSEQILGAPRMPSPQPLSPPGSTTLDPGERESDAPIGSPAGDPLAVGLRVLLIGNSYTMHNTLHVLLERVAAGVEGGPKLEVDAEAHGGFSLRNHLRGRRALQRIRSGHYTHVVLQGHSLSAVDHPQELSIDAESFKQVIDAASSRTVFYATWARSPEVRLYRKHKIVHSFEEMSDRVSSTYLGLSERLGTGLAPVGRAFERALVQNPRLALWGSDGSHPTLAGSYMAACVLYGAITGADPRHTTYLPAGLTASDAAILRSIAFASMVVPSPVHTLVGAQTPEPAIVTAQ